ncbi:MAG: polysaccharide deacetylase family protein [Sutterellaceae bacterium]|nr:polysaccharide deacetylase family protein [Burkholderiaceae bacterium]MCX7901664.1 polysaccharide deacetylase family protein [Burkholderiaceae bacterium]MDW8430300.1 polysaccharide deacetylase family protein [Sutterellaceae bacterium]
MTSSTTLQWLSRGLGGIVVRLAAGLAPGRPLSVLIFHRVMRAPDPLRPYEPTAAQFDALMRWLSEQFRVLPLLEAVRALRTRSLPPRALCITFDDGYTDNYEVALPILQKYGLPATFFIATGYLEGGCMFNDVVIEAVRGVREDVLDLQDLRLGRHPVANDRDKLAAIAALLQRLKYEPVARRMTLALQIAARCGTGVPTDLMMRAAQVAALHRAGMQVGAHTVHHPILATLEPQQAQDEIARSKAQLQEIIGAAVQVFAYPNGQPQRDYQRCHVEMVRALGFEAAVSTAWGVARVCADPLQIPRFTPWDRSLPAFGLRLAVQRWRTRYERV